MMLANEIKINYSGVQDRMKNAQKKLIDNVLELHREGMSEEEIDSIMEIKQNKKLMQKVKKANYIEKNIHKFDTQIKSKHLINFFVRSNDYDSWENILIFNTNDLEVVRKEMEEDLWMEIDGSSWTSPYDCTGRTFYYPAKFYQFKDRIIVKHSGRLDV